MAPFDDDVTVRLDAFALMRQVIAKEEGESMAKLIEKFNTGLPTTDEENAEIFRVMRRYNLMPDVDSLPHQPLDLAYMGVFEYFVDHRPGNARPGKGVDGKDLDRLVVSVAFASRRSRRSAVEGDWQVFAASELERSRNSWTREAASRRASRDFKYGWNVW